MKQEILPLSAAMLLSLLWSYISLWSLVRMSGTAVTWNPLKVLRRKLSGGQSLAIGILCFGGALLVFDLLHRYIRWKLYGTGADRLTPERLLVELVGDVFAGVVLGFTMMFTTPKKSMN